MEERICDSSYEKNIESWNVMKKYIGILVKITGIMLAVILAVNIILTLIKRNPDSAYEKELEQTTFTAESEKESGGSRTWKKNVERIRCIDDNEEALLWRLRMIGNAKKSIVLSTFDLRPDNSGTKIIAVLYAAAERGVQVQILIDGIYQKLFLEKSPVFQALTAHQNVEVGIYNPVTNLFRLNYRMHDKYLIIDESMYLLGGRNTNDIFLGDKKTGINVDRDILVYEESEGQGESLQELEKYFGRIWNEAQVRKTKKTYAVSYKEKYKSEYQQMEGQYRSLKEKYPDIEDYEKWAEDTYEADKITLINNGTQAARKSPKVLQAIGYIAGQGDDVVIQTPYVICNSYMYQELKEISEKAELKIILNAVEKGSNPWGCTDYLNQKENILKTGATVYELMNAHAVHTKTVLVDDNISIVGSYNLDMRSTYLDTELMLVIDSERLNEEIRDTENVYMEKSKEVKADGTETEGRLYKKKVLTPEKKRFYAFLKIIIRPFRHLL